MLLSVCRKSFIWDREAVFSDPAKEAESDCTVSVGNAVAFGLSARELVFCPSARHGEKKHKSKQACFNRRALNRKGLGFIAEWILQNRYSINHCLILFFC